MKERDLIAGRLFWSINALAVFWAAAFQFARRAAQLKRGKLDQDSADKEATDVAHKYLDRWLTASTWAQRWAASSAKVLQEYAQQLGSDLTKHENAVSLSAAAKVYDSRLQGFLEGVMHDAQEHINYRLGVDERGQVSQYFGPLWLWHRLDTFRWSASTKPLQIGRMKVAIDVDHVVSVKLWKETVIPDGTLSEDETAAEVHHSLGNCVLLNKSFNIVKSDDSLRTFMNKVHEFKGTPEKVEPWAANLGISTSMLDGSNSDVKQLVADIRNRDRGIRSDLVRFIRGELIRVDVPSAAAP